ncbi:MAG: hypothetical protein Q9M76_07325, partial [Candidatus Dojkabacteria bacterium]|nr:hypothetical protein [Candidatus Dojkabacteria bacterium]
REKPKSNKKLNTKLNTKGIFIVFILIPIAILGYFYFTSKVSVIIEVKRDEVNLSKTIQADTTLEEIDLGALTITASEVTTSKVSGQRSGTATKIANKGEKASGFVNIYNTTTGAVQIPSGSIISNATGNLKYEILEDVSLEGTKLGNGVAGENAGAVADDVPVAAISFGEEYNLTGTESNTQFVIEGFENTSEIYAKRFRSFEGGTSEEFTTVSTSDIEAVKAVLLEELKNESYQSVRNSVPSGYKIIDNTITFEETLIETNPEAGEEVIAEEGAEKVFTLSLEGVTKAIAINCNDLIELAKAEFGGNTKLSCNNIEISNVVASGTSVTFDIASSTTVSSSVNQEDLIELIKGKAFSDVEEILETDPNIMSAKASYSPFPMPGFLRYVSNNSERIEIIIRD